MKKLFSIALILCLSYSCSSEQETPEKSITAVPKDVKIEDVHDFTLGEVMVNGPHLNMIVKLKLEVNSIVILLKHLDLKEVLI